MNALFTISPYKDKGSWVFDDESRGLDKEPFVAGIDDMLDALSSGGTKINLVFSSNPFPGFDITMTRLHEEMGGYWFKCEELNMNGWLCPAMFKYFEDAPEKIYAKFKNIL